jgi:hypothetical protein
MENYMSNAEMKVENIQVEVKLDEELENLGGIQGSSTSSYTQTCSSSNLTDGCCW